MGRSQADLVEYGALFHLSRFISSQKPSLDGSSLAGLASSMKPPVEEKRYFVSITKLLRTILRDPAFSKMPMVWISVSNHEAGPSSVRVMSGIQITLP